MSILNEISPEFFSKMEGLLGHEFQAFRACFEEPPAMGLRFNTLKCEPAKILSWLPYALQAVPWCPTGYSFLRQASDNQEMAPGKHPLHAAGLYYLQDPSAMAVAELLNPQPGEKVLDLAAAPGGKSTHLAALMQNQGLLVANEIHPQRVWDLAENLERWGVTCAVITNETPNRLADHLGDLFDRVLIDAPCSGEGMFRKSAAARREWNPNLPNSCATRQSAILYQAARLVRPGGWLAYTTCTFSPEENEGVIEQFLQQESQDGGHGFTLVKMERMWPHLGAPEGHFLSLLHKKTAENKGKSTAQTDRKIRAGGSRSPQWESQKQAEQRFRAFCEENLSKQPEQSQLLLRGSYLYKTPVDLPSLGELRVIHPGLWLGIQKKGWFEPSHAWALSLKSEDVRRRAVLQGEEALRYLRGESLENQGENGWTLVTIGAGPEEPFYPMGWGKRIRGVLKNSYPKGLRIPG